MTIVTISKLDGGYHLSLSAAQPGKYFHKDLVRSDIESALLAAREFLTAEIDALPFEEIKPPSKDFKLHDRY